MPKGSASSPTGIAMPCSAASLLSEWSVQSQASDGQRHFRKGPSTFWPMNAQGEAPFGVVG
jgi:hypothetical protein